MVYARAFRVCARHRVILCQLYNYKFESLLQRTLLAPIFISWAIAEVHRIYFGCKGNIKEMVRT